MSDTNTILAERRIDRSTWKKPSEIAAELKLEELAKRIKQAASENKIIEISRHFKAVPCR